LVHAVILAGGRGERFWPLSRAHRPKQLLRLISDKTMLQETIDRITPLIPMERLLIVTSTEMVDAILGEMKNLSRDNILVEPESRNTCIAIGLAAEHLKKTDPEAVMVVLSADHIIGPAEKLLELIKAGATVATEEDKLITIGIEPTRPETGYGYIKMAERYKSINDISIFKVDSFVEKPNPPAAQEYYLGRQYLWNSGMFIWSAEAILKAIARCRPLIGDLLSVYSTKIGSPDEVAERENVYAKSEPISIDFAVLENAENVLAIKGDIMWDDVGSWNALERYKKKDQNNNVIIGQAKVAASYETTVYNNNEGIIVSLGVSDLVIVKTDDIVFVAHKTRVNEVKKILKELSRDDQLRQFV
jgi:mannose-1-phosphate guanylyltransferase